MALSASLILLANTCAGMGAGLRSVVLLAMVAMLAAPVVLVVAVKLGAALLTVVFAALGELFTWLQRRGAGAPEVVGAEAQAQAPEPGLRTGGPFGGRAG